MRSETDRRRLLPPIGSAEDYSHALRRLEAWRPAVMEVCRREGIDADADSLRLGLVGTYPTVLVADRWVVKLIGPWWSGPESFAVEADAYDLLAADPALPVPRRLAQGELVPGEWRYMVLSRIPGVPLGAVFDDLSVESRLEVARWLGGVVRDLNGLPRRPGRVLQPSWEPFAAFLANQRSGAVGRHQAWGSLPPHLVAQLDAWLPPVEALIDRERPPVFVHGDLHDDHIFGVVEGDRFRPNGIIDFSDVQVGDPYYELGPLQRFAFRCDRTLLDAFRETAGLPQPGPLVFPRRALAYLLLHEFDQLENLPWLAEIADLDELAARLFGEPRPGAGPVHAPIKPWLIDELAHAGPEHLDPAFVAGYDHKQGNDPTEDLAVLRDHGVDESATVVDLGAGTGRFALAAAAQFRRVIAVDISPAMQDFLRTQAAEAGFANIDCVHAGFLTYEHVGPPVDAVYSRNALHQLPDFWKAVALERIARILRPRGVLRLRDLIFDFQPAQTDEVLERWLDGAADDPAEGYTRADFAEHLRAEYSTFRWLLEPMLAAAGFEVVQADFSQAIYGAYTCVKV